VTTPTTAQEAAGRAAEAIRTLNHRTLPGTAQLDVVDVYDVLAELALLAGRLPQLLRQLVNLVDDLVEAGEVRIVEGPNTGDPVAAAAVTGHWLAAASSLAAELAPRIEPAQQALAWAAPPDPFGK
jgi:hypothetical protein